MASPGQLRLEQPTAPIAVELRIDFEVHWELLGCLESTSYPRRKLAVSLGTDLLVRLGAAVSLGMDLQLDLQAVGLPPIGFESPTPSSRTASDQV
jgi:hypothetical protein